MQCLHLVHFEHASLGGFSVILLSHEEIDRRSAVQDSRLLSDGRPRRRRCRRLRSVARMLLLQLTRPSGSVLELLPCVLGRIFALGILFVQPLLRDGCRGRWSRGGGSPGPPSRSLSMTTTTSPSKAIITGKMRRSRSGHTTRARRRVGDARNVSHYLPGHHIAAQPRRKLTAGSCCARVSSALRVVRPAVVSVVALRTSGTLSVCITTSKEPRAG